MVNAYDPQVVILNKTANPNVLVCYASSQTMRQMANESDSPTLAQYLLKANHTSVFEHATVTFKITDISRACSLQLLRHRMQSPTSSSQHYQKYDEYPVFMCEVMAKNATVRAHVEQTLKLYDQLIEEGIDKSEARQILPEGIGVNLVVTTNARQLVNFLNLRLCLRNTLEMQMLAERVLIECKKWFPELFNYVGPDCFMHKTCKQGKMTCGKVWFKE